MFAICRQSIIPLREKPDLVSEMISQVICGEAAEIVSSQGIIGRIRLLHDDYEGYADLRQFTPPQEERPEPAGYITDDVCGPAIGDRRTIHLLQGTPLPHFQNGSFRLGGEAYSWHGHVREIPAEPRLATVLELASRYLEAPYQWGGRGIFGIDCSGFTQALYRAAGYPLLRDTTQQVTQGFEVCRLDEALPGDLIFCEGTRDRARHVGLLLPDRSIMHASAMVRTDDLVEEGIRNRLTGQVSHRITAIRRILAE